MSSDNLVKVLSSKFKSELYEIIQARKMQVNVIGLIASKDPASIKYAGYTASAAQGAGINYQLKETRAQDVVSVIKALNANTQIHGIIVYFPIFGDERDKEIKNEIAPEKDIEGLSNYWIARLDSNIRYDEALGIKCILPCTALSVLKVVEEAISIRSGHRDLLSGKKIAIFNRSDVVGYPLAKMLFNDGATVFSFDESGGKVLSRTSNLQDEISRAEALAASDVIITGVPSNNFEKISDREIAGNPVIVNFSFIDNVTDAAKKKAGCFIPRIGELTVTLCLRNAVRIASIISV